jgi:hypothetical protein
LQERPQRSPRQELGDDTKHRWAITHSNKLNRTITINKGTTFVVIGLNLEKQCAEILFQSVCIAFVR